MNPVEALNSLHRRGQLVAELKATQEGRRAWLGIYVLDPAVEESAIYLRRVGFDLSQPTTKVYRVRTFELKAELIETNVWEGDLELTRDHLARTDEALIQVLASLGLTLESLEYPWETDYPI